MGSIAAEEVAREVLGNLGKPVRPNITQIAIRKGLKPKYANSGQVQKTKAYRAIIDPYANRLKRHQEKILKAMEAKDLSEEDYKTLTDSLAKVTHDVQILTGGSTENVQQVLVRFIDAKHN